MSAGTKGRWPGGATQLAGVVGDPISHTMSPLLHNAGYAALGLDWCYLAFRVGRGDLPEAMRGARALGLRGLSVTTPHKEAAAAAADQRSALVERLEAANTVVFRHGMSVADSTDGAGFLDDLRTGADFDPADKTVAVLGAGGAARAVILALGQAGAAEVLVVNRTAARGETAAALAGATGRTATIEELAGADLVVQATSAGLRGSASLAGAAGDPMAEIGARCRPGQIAYDLGYHPAVSSFLAAASAAGAEVRNGLGMLVHQAARQFSLFTGEPAPLQAMWAAIDLPSGGDPGQ
ncbi:MAG: shikimate dehydrogenase [Acidimicrobiaceae bacterium]|nr:shikimate dehydrogenase [Acidimicrobiaceae bacterium]